MRKRDAMPKRLQRADPRVADLVRAGSVRVALFPPMYTQHPVTGEIGGMQIELACALAARLGIEVRPIIYSTPAAVVEGLTAGACDLAFLVIDPSRAAVVDFSTPYVERDFTYLVPAGSSIRRVADADRPGLRIAVVRTHASELALRSLLKQAALVPAETPDAAFDWLRRGTVDLLASARQDLLQYASQLPGSHVLPDRYGSSAAAVAVPKDHPGWLAYLSAFIEEAKASGLVQRAIERAGQGSVQVSRPNAPPA
jgi:polar amino acid transport system substrate-binding protein